MSTDGYKGIMELDLTGVDPKQHKIIIEQHKKDIENYKKEQSKLNPILRYDNSVGKALQSIEFQNKLKSRRFFKIDE